MSVEIDNELGNQGIKPIIAVDKKRPQFFNFDASVAAPERPVEKVLPVRLRVAHHQESLVASTSAISLRTVRITLSKKAAPVTIGDRLLVDFVSIHAKLNQDYFLEIPY